MKNKMIGFLLFLIYKSLYFTWRVRFVEPEVSKDLRVGKKPYILAHWHGDIPGILYMLKPLHAAAIISQSKDGDIVDTMARLLGSKTSRGSSTRGGAGALKGILRLAKEGWTPAIAIDGPKGPRHEAKPGIFEISRIIGSPIVPMTCAIDRKWTFHKAWDRTKLPKPFAKIVISYGEPLPAVPRDRDGRDPDLARALQIAMANAEQKAQAQLTPSQSS
jgi:lysophospholipid acyltransferase (LPLAT)-like uncharacterized protein